MRREELLIEREQLLWDRAKNAHNKDVDVSEEKRIKKEEDSVLKRR